LKQSVTNSRQVDQGGKAQYSSSDLSDTARRFGVSADTAEKIWVAARNGHGRNGAVPARVARLLAVMEDTLDGEDGIRQYLDHPNRSFLGEKPIDLLVRGEFERVEANLLAIQEGVYL
jgi:uncharacterized protein (DUF2384 family)